RLPGRHEHDGHRVLPARVGPRAGHGLAVVTLHARHGGHGDRFCDPPGHRFDRNDLALAGWAFAYDLERLWHRARDSDVQRRSRHVERRFDDYREIGSGFDDDGDIGAGLWERRTRCEGPDPRNPAL